MNDPVRQLVQAIHGSRRRTVIALTGGGSGAIGELLRVPGGSHTLLEAIVPYDYAALIEFLGREPESACSPDTAIAMARQARRRAGQLCRDETPLIGLGATASLVSNQPKKGDHRIHIATDCGDTIRTRSVILEKDLRDRPGEEDLAAREILFALAEACDVQVPVELQHLSPSERRTCELIHGSDPIDRLLDGRIDRVTILPDGQFVEGATVPRGVLPGSFNPLHAGHLKLARVARELLGGRVSFEISVLNVDKPPLEAAAIRRRVNQFAWHSSVELTRAPTFLEKARVLPGTTFIVGADTAERIVAPKYYGNSEPAMHAALTEIAHHNCRFLVAGRVDSRGQFQTLAGVQIPPPIANHFSAIPEIQFRIDCCSTELRKPMSS